MTSLATQILHIRDVLQDANTPDDVLITAHQEALRYLGRIGTFGAIQWMQGVAGQARYPLPSSSVTVTAVFYNMQALRYTTEAALDRRYRLPWESLLGDPLYWAIDNQDPHTLRVIPRPLRTGSAIPILPPVPLAGDLRNNLVLFLTEDVAEQVNDPADEIPMLADWGDLALWRTIRMLAGREDDAQNLPVAELCQELETLWDTKLREV